MDQPLHCLHLLYHELRRQSSSYSYATDATEFEKHANLFAFIRAGGQDSVWPEITFDDGHISNYEVALPILQSRGLTACFFITAGWTGKRQDYMGWKELRALHEAGQTIGGHGWTHTLLTHCSHLQLKQELEGTRLCLEDHLGTSIFSMSLPGGRYSRRVLAACYGAGYTQVYTSVPKLEALPPGKTIGRLNILRGMSTEQLTGLLELNSNTLASYGREYRVKQLAKTLMGDRMYERLWAMRSKQEERSKDGEAVEG